MGRLIGIAYSPWTLRARWVLGLREEYYSFEAYRPFWDEIGLRLELRRPFGHISVPIYIDERGIYDDSRLIAEHINSLGLAWDLFPSEEFASLNSLTQRAEDFAFAGRAFLTQKIEADPKALEATITFLMPKGVAPILNKFPAGVISLFNSKYKIHSKDLDGWRGLLRMHLEKMSEQYSGGPYLLAEFSYADIALATALQFVAPVDASYVELPKGTQMCWGDPSLAEEFPEILQWRDGLFAKHWPKSRTLV